MVEFDKVLQEALRTLDHFKDLWEECGYNDPDKVFWQTTCWHVVVRDACTLKYDAEGVRAMIGSLDRVGTHMSSTRTFRVMRGHVQAVDDLLGAIYRVGCLPPTSGSVQNFSLNWSEPRRVSLVKTTGGLHTWHIRHHNSGVTERVPVEVQDPIAFARSWSDTLWRRPT